MLKLNSFKIGLYARVSSEKQVQEKTIQSQIASIIDHASSLEEKIDPSLHFIDDGVSGALLERPGLDRLRDKAFSGEINKLYILSPDRLSRKSAHQMILIEELKKLGIIIVFVNRNITDTPEDQMLLQIQGIIAEYEREKILERSRRGKLFAAQTGKVNALGGAPYGYYYQKITEFKDANYIIHAQEAAVVKEAFWLYCEKNLTITKIVSHFENKGYLTRSGSTRWSRSVIWGMLRNPAYKGTAAFRKTKAIKSNRRTKQARDSKNYPYGNFRTTVDRPEADWIYIPVPSIIDEKTFAIAQQKLKDNSKFAPRNNKKHNYLLNGLLRCKNCGYAFYGKTSSGDNIRLYYRCCGQDNDRFVNGRVCKGRSVRVEAIDDLVWGSIKKLLLTPEVITEEYDRRLKVYQNFDNGVISEKTKEINKYKKERFRLIDLYQTGLIDNMEIEMKLKSIRAKMEQLEKEITYLNNKEDESNKFLTVINNLNDFSDKITKNLDCCNFQEKKSLVRMLVKEVEVDTIKAQINVQHIIPLDIKKYQLCSGGY